MKNLLKQYFGYDEFRPLQEEIINNIVSGRDTFVLMPTGGGKSLCYQLPALKFQGITLVISPLIALMKDQVDALKANGIKAEFINSSLTGEEIAGIYESAKSGDLKILYVAPERFALPGFKEFLKELKINQIAIDEAHCISEWGHDFRPDYRNLSELKNLFPEVPLVALTATATPWVKKDILNQLNIPNAGNFVSGFDRENLKLSVVNKKKSFPKLLGLLERYKGESVIIYCFSRKETEEIANNLELKGFSVKAYHAGLEKNERRIVQNQFIKDQVDIIVATIAFGMGVDKPDVRLVVHYTFPKTLEGYYQEIGRAGRDGLPSECVMFYTYADTRKHMFFINDLETRELQEKAQKKLNNVLEYADLRNCRKQYLLEYFGETANDNCGACDNCLTEREVFDATEVAQKILSAIFRTESRFGKKYIIDVLRGANAQRIRRNGHDRLSVHGIVNDFDEDELGQIINDLIGKGHISKAEGKYPTLNITSKGIAFLKNGEKLELPKPEKDKLSVRSETKEEIDYNTELFSLLREERKRLAEKENVPPFVIFGDAALREMAAYLPCDKNAFGKISGVGETKLEKYSDNFTEIIDKFSKKNNLTPAEIPHKPTKEKGTRVYKMEKYSKTKELIDKKISVDRIAKKQGLKQETIINHIERLLDSGAKLDLEYLKLPKDKFEKIKSAFEEVGSQYLKPVYEYLEGEYSYEDLKIVRVILEK